jgi:hypothetical protein
MTNEDFKKSWDSMVAWIVAVEGRQQVVFQNGHYSGPIQKLTSDHALQKIGRNIFVIHALNDLDHVPVLNNPKMMIKYKLGLGTISCSSGSIAHHQGRSIFSHEIKKSLQR